MAKAEEVLVAPNPSIELSAQVPALDHTDQATGSHSPKSTHPPTTPPTSPARTHGMEENMTK